ncbi:MAG: hypothetical protein LRY66_04485 [Saccharospirillaceae bacterium]|nr:hypothetical protein [Saccharospirillaceae bacterium]MCD8530616.1 hypothetical protein [Saccharospirillaceae bacterium]
MAGIVRLGSECPKKDVSEGGAYAEVLQIREMIALPAASRAKQSSFSELGLVIIIVNSVAGFIFIVWPVALRFYFYCLRRIFYWFVNYKANAVPTC